MSLVTIHTTQLPVVEYRGQRVVTLAMIDQVHERPEGTAKRNFGEHRDRFIEGRHYFEVSRDEIRTDLPVDIFSHRAPRGLLITERGYLLLVKAFNDELAWDVQEQLVEHYFQPSAPRELSRLELLEIAIASERQNLRLTAERDHAVATKAEIGHRREATAMATASAAMRQVRRLQDDLGQGSRQAAVLAVEKAAHRKFGVSGYVPLRRWCKARGITAPKVFHPTFGSVRCWPAGAWLDVYNIDLAELFGAEGDTQC